MHLDVRAHTVFVCTGMLGAACVSVYTLPLSIPCILFPPPPLKKIYKHGTVVLGGKKKPHTGEDLKGPGFVRLL